MARRTGVEPVEPAGPLARLSGEGRPDGPLGSDGWSGTVSTPQTEPEHAADERELIARAKAGERPALGELVRRHYGLLRALLARSGCAPTPADVDDLVHEAFLRALGALGRYEPHGSLRTWLYRIALNLARDRRRRSRRLVMAADVAALAGIPDYDRDPGDLVAARLDAAGLAKAVDRLPEAHRDVVLLRFYADLPVDEVARIVGCPAGTVKSRLHYALRKLRGLLADPDKVGGQMEREGAR